MPNHPTDPACIFCKIVAGQIPCHRIHEDEHTLTFLDIGPLSRGHSLIIPKGHYATLDLLPSPIAGVIGAALPRLGRALVAATGIPAWNVLQNNGTTAGQVVPHVHFHLIPRTPNDNLGYRWPAGKLDPSEAKQLVDAIRKGLEG